MRILLLSFLFAVPVAAQGMPSARFVHSWRSAHNQKRLSLAWNVLPDNSPKKLPDGTTEPRKAPWPFLLYVVQQTGSRSNKKLQEKVFEDTRFVLATHAVKLIKVKPRRVVDIPYLDGVPGIKDPALIFVGRDFKVLGALKTHKDFTASKVLALMVKVAGTAYKGRLGAYVGSYFKLLAEEEKLWKQERKLEKMSERAAVKDKAKAKQLDKEVEEGERALEAAREELAESEIRIQDSLQLVGEKRKALPTSVGTGKKRRKLTPEELEAIATFREFARDENPIVRAAAVEDLGAIDSAAMVAVILKAANDLDPRVTQAAGKALGRMKSSESLDAMLAGLSGKAKAKQACLWGFGAVARPYPAALPKIIPFLASGGDDIRRAAIQAIRNQRDAAGAAALLPLLDDRLPALRVLAANALGELKVKQAAAPLCVKLGARDWSMKKAAAGALARIRARESIEPLLAAFEKEKGLMVEVLYRALVAVTGQDYRYSPANWRKWWIRWGKSFQVPTDAQIAAARKKAADALKGYYNPDKKKYHKIETLSRKMIFLLDISSSMKDKIIIPHNAPPELKAEFPNRVKMEIAKKELIDLLATLDGKVYFNIIVFAGKVKPWKDGLISGTARTAAIKYVAKLKPLEAPRGGRRRSGSGEEQKTNTYGALLAALGLAGQAVPDWKARAKVDTIFLVTDGLPTTGEIIEVPKVIAAITELNQSRGIVIHVITFDRIAHQRLTPLAIQNHGQCVLRGA